MQTGMEILRNSWEILLDASVYVLFGLLVGGLLKVFLSPGLVARHLGKEGAGTVVKAALIGIPLPVCSCGVLPIAAALKKQGASNGATTSFLVSTPESGVDSISITYALLDPFMTVARPLAAFFSAMAAGLSQNYFFPPGSDFGSKQLSRTVADKGAASCCPPPHAVLLPRRRSPGTLISDGIRFACGELWGNIAVWFLIGILLSGILTVLVPDSLLVGHGDGLTAKLVMLVIGIPLYTCASASTPIAAALILKGVSPGAALVYLLVGPATSMASLTVLTGILGRRATMYYLAALAASALFCGILVDFFYGSLGISAQAMAGQAAELIPFPLQLAGALLLLVLSIRPFWKAMQSLVPARSGGAAQDFTPCGCPDDGDVSSGPPLHGFKGS
jgi:uncharacterized protein